MTNEQIQRLLDSCDKLQQRTIYEVGCAHSSTRTFNACMRAFDSALPPNSITFAVYFNVPVMQRGFARIHNDGHMELWTAGASGWEDAE